MLSPNSACKNEVEFWWFSHISPYHFWTLPHFLIYLALPNHANVFRFKSFSILITRALVWPILPLLYFDKLVNFQIIPFCLSFTMFVHPYYSFWSLKSKRNSWPQIPLFLIFLWFFMEIWKKNSRKLIELAKNHDTKPKN